MWYGIVLQVAQEPEPGLSLRGVLHNIPMEPSSLFVYFLLLGGVLWVIAGSWGNRRKGKRAK